MKSASWFCAGFCSAGVVVSVLVGSPGLIMLNAILVAINVYQATRGEDE